MDRKANLDLYRRVDAAFKSGDLDALREICGDTEAFPNVRAPHEAIACSLLQYAIYHSPVAFVRQLLEHGADANYDDGAGFPSLLAALITGRPPGKVRELGEVRELLTLLLDFGADPNQRGVNDYTPLHWVAQYGDSDLAELFLARGADASVRTGIDDYETPAEVAEHAGRHALADLLRRAEDQEQQPS